MASPSHRQENLDEEDEFDEEDMGLEFEEDRADIVEELKLGEDDGMEAVDAEDEMDGVDRGMAVLLLFVRMIS